MKYFFTYKTMMFWIIFLLAAVTFSFFYMGEKADTYNPCKDPEKNINANLQQSIDSSKNFFKFAKFIPIGITLFILIFLIVGHVLNSKDEYRQNAPIWVFLNLSLIFILIMVTIIGISHVQNLLKIRHYQCGSSNDEQTKLLKTTVKSCIVSIGCIIGSYIGLLINNWVKYDVDSKLQTFVIILSGILMIGGLAGGNMLVDNLNTKILGKNECGLFSEEIKALGTIGGAIDPFKFLGLNDTFGSLLPKGVSFKEKINTDFNKGQTPIQVEVSVQSGKYEPEESVTIKVKTDQEIPLEAEVPAMKLVLPNNFIIQRDIVDLASYYDATKKVINKQAEIPFTGVRLPKSLGKTDNISVLIGDNKGNTFIEKKSSRNHFFIIQKKNSVFVNNILADGETNQIYKYTPEFQFESASVAAVAADTANGIAEVVPVTGNVVGIVDGVLSLNDGDTPNSLTLVSTTSNTSDAFAVNDLVLLKHQDNTSENGIYKYIPAVVAPATPATPAKLEKQDIIIEPSKFDFSNANLLNNKIFDSSTEGISFYEGVANDINIQGFDSTLERVDLEKIKKQKEALVTLFMNTYGSDSLTEDSDENEFKLVNSIKDYLNSDPAPATADFMKIGDFTTDSKINIDPANLGIFKPVFNVDGTSGSEANTLFTAGKTTLVDTNTKAAADPPTDVNLNEYYKNSLQLLIFYYNRKILYPTLKIKYTDFPKNGSVTFTLSGVKNPSYSGKMETTISTGQQTPTSYSIDIRNAESESSTKDEFCPVITKYDFSKMLINSIFSGWAVSTIMYISGSLYGVRRHQYNLGYLGGSRKSIDTEKAAAAGVAAAAAIDSQT